MSEKSFRVEVGVHAPRELVWRALTEPDEIRRWFGWDYDGLDEEIRFIFIDHARDEPPDRIVLDDGTTAVHTFELESDGPRTLVRVARAGSDAGADDFDMIEEGWRTFLEQLRHQLERHAGEERRTIRLDGEADPGEVIRAVEAALGGEGECWRAGRYQWLLATPRHGDGLVSVSANEPLDTAGRTGVGVTVVTYGLDDEAFDATRREWEERWSALAGGSAT
jgi:uncharacterized protein YndB with AHSA1/START domain